MNAEISSLQSTDPARPQRPPDHSSQESDDPVSVELGVVQSAS